ncbi:MAG: shikimate dehydrogenase [Haliea sp.]|nr:shikimate dehydrogenase [Haliea sp.]
MTDIDRYAVFGNPIKQSKSPAIHAMFAEQCSQAILYRAVKVELDGFVRAATHFFNEGGCGLNVTVPFKQEAFAFAHQLSARASRAGAVNMLTRAADGIIHGENTDGVGLIRDLIANLGWTVQGARVLLVGAGGAARGVLEPLLRERPQELLIVNRTGARATQLAGEFADLGPLEGGAFDLIAARQFDLVINATSAGLSGAVPELPGTLLTERSCCYDMVYGAEPTPFMRWSAHHAAWAVADGLGMLVEQAAESFYIWRNRRPVTALVINQLRASMSAS